MTDTNTDSILENGNYKIRVGTSTLSDKDIKVYQLFNKDTNVIEHETTILPEMIQYYRKFSEDLVIFLCEEKGVANMENVNQADIIEINPNDKTPVH